MCKGRRRGCGKQYFESCEDRVQCMLGSLGGISEHSHGSRGAAFREAQK